MYHVKFLSCFKRQMKGYLKKFPSLSGDIIRALRSFEKNRAINLGVNNYKIRISCTDLKRGKSKSFRLILHVIEIKNLLLPIAIYFKSDRANISQKEIIAYLQIAIYELENEKKILQFQNTIPSLTTPRGKEFFIFPYFHFVMHLLRK